MSIELQALKTRMQSHGLAGEGAEVANQLPWIVPIDLGGCNSCKPGCQPGCTTCNSGCSQGNQGGG